MEKENVEGGGKKKTFEVSINGIAECHLWSYTAREKKLVNSVILSLFEVIPRAEMENP